MKFKGVEVNGVANIHMIISMAKAEGKIDPTVADDILDQCDAIERYQLAHFQDPNVKWHEVRDNREKYPLNGGRKK